MRLVILLAILSILTSCKSYEKPDSWLCTFISGDHVHGVQSYAFCVHQRTGQEKIAVPAEMHKWVVTDPDSYHTIVKWYKNKCGNN